MAHITRRAIRWSIVAIGCTVFAMSARVVLPAQAVSLNVPRAVESRVRRDLESGHFDQVPINAIPVGAQPVVAVSVPATAVVRVDDDGRVITAMTNTGQPPRPDDDLWLMHPDGSIESAPVEQFADHVWIGDFTDAGVYVAQTQ